MTTQQDHATAGQPTFKFSEVRREELASIQERRRKLNEKSEDRPSETKSPGSIQQDDIENDLCGLALSGGGIRSACFNLGLLQAFHRYGLFRYFDYLSTVSGGGYIGAHVSSWVMRHKKTVSAENDSFPLPAADEHGRQVRSVRHLIYGGDYIIDGLTALNKYLIGFVLNNLAVFSWLVFAAAIVAMTWRTLDTFWVRDRLALIGLGSDLAAPFIPSAVFFMGWMGAWVLSYFKQEAEAPGTIARHLLRLAACSVLVAGALLVGNGDVAIPWISDMSDPSGIPKVYWMPLVVVTGILILMIPIVRPSRLLRSATAPTGPLDKWVFTAVTSAALGGVPLILIGVLGRENLSGYSTFPDRGLHDADVKNFNELCGLVIGLDDNLSSEFVSGEVVLLSKDAGQLYSGANWNSETKSKAFLGKLIDGVIRQNKNGLHDENIDDFQQAIAWIAEGCEVLKSEDSEQFTEWFQKTAGQGPISEHTFRLYAEATESDNQSLPDDSEAHTEKDRSWDYLQFLASRVIVLSRTEQKLRHEMDVREDQESSFNEDSFNPSRWQRFTFDDNAERLFNVAGFLVWDADNEVRRYFQAFESHRKMRQRFIEFFNRAILFSDDLTIRLLAEVQRKLTAEKNLDSAQNEAWAASLVQAREVALYERTAFPSRFEIANTNRRLLELCFPAVFRPATDYQRRIVISEDQWCRAQVAFLALIVGIAVGLLLDINATSMHRYYRTRLASAFVVPPEASDSLPLSMMTTTQFGAPYHLMGACVSLFGRRKETSDDETLLGPCSEGSVEDPRRQDTFLMSQRFVGSDASGFVRTKDYEEWIVGDGNQVDLDEAVALSGAAVSPTQNENLFVAFLMFCLNLRLGQWLPNPAVGKPRFRPRFLYLLTSIWKSRERRPYVFVSDGGHNENLGVLELLKRRCRLIVVSDAGHDPEHTFTDLANAVQLSRIFEGIQFVEFSTRRKATDDEMHREMSLEVLKRCSPSADGNPLSAFRGTDDYLQKTVKRHFHAVRILYPAQGTFGPAEGLLLIVKPSISGDEPLDLLEYRKAHPAFPQEPTTELVFTPSQVECYRRLGFHIGEELCGCFHPSQQFQQHRQASGDTSRNLWSPDAPQSVSQLACQIEDIWREKAGGGNGLEFRRTRSTVAEDSRTDTQESNAGN